MRPGTILLDTTTGDPAGAIAMAAPLAARDILDLDATISGSSPQVRGGAVAIMVDGPHEIFRACSEVFACFGRQIFYTGPTGTGAAMKLVTNLVPGLNRAALDIFGALRPNDLSALARDSTVRPSSAD